MLSCYGNTRYQSNMTKEVLDTIMSIQPKDSSAGPGNTREDIVKDMAKDFLSKLPGDYAPHDVCNAITCVIILSVMLVKGCLLSCCNKPHGLNGMCR